MKKSGKKNNEKGYRDIHKSANKRLALAIPTGNDPQPVGGPLEIIDPTREDPKLILEDVIVVCSPDADGAGDVGGGDPLAVGGVACDGDGVCVLAVDGDGEGVVEVADDDGSGGAVEEVVGFGVAGDEDAAAAFRGGNARVGLREGRHSLVDL